MSDAVNPIDILFDKPVINSSHPSLRRKSLFIFAHGAGAPMDSDFMNQFAKALAKKGVGVVRFEFPYMAQRRHGGSRRPPNQQALLLQTWVDIVSQLHADSSFNDFDYFFLGGKSMGGRMATLAVNDIVAKDGELAKKVTGLIALGYPFHPSGKPESLRIEHLPSLERPLLIAQGTRDALGNLQEVLQYALGDQTRLVWLEDGDHDLKPRKKSGFTHDEHIASAVEASVEFIEEQSA